MKKKLLLLDLLLLALLAVLGQRVRQSWLEARKRESVVLGQRLQQAPPPPYAPLTPPPPVTAAAYGEVAQQMLFSPERNPTVIVEIPKPPPMPKLPAYYGLMSFGDEGATAIMSEKNGAPHQEVKFGQKIGEFTLVTIAGDQIVLEWKGEKVVRKVEELADRAAAPNAPAEPQGPAAPPSPVVSTVSSASSGPGPEVSAGRRACLPGDAAAPGTVSDGYRKSVRDSPFGKICQWEAVK